MQGWMTLEKFRDLRCYGLPLLFVREHQQEGLQLRRVAYSVEVQQVAAIQPLLHFGEVLRLPREGH